MRFHDSDEYRRGRRLGVLHDGPRLSRHEAHTIFREMVRAECRNGPLGTQRRRRLIQYAAALQLEPLEASRIVTEITTEQCAPADLEPPLLYRVVETAARPSRWPAWIAISGALVAAFAIKLLVNRAWFGG